MLNDKKKNGGAGEELGMTVRQRLRQKRELEEKRKFGLAPLAVDEITGQEISPNVPQLISQAPWYYGSNGPTLDHQRQKQTDAMDTLQDQHDSVTVLGKATAYAAGACANCGSSTHKANECYKPRKKVGAVYTGKVTGVDMQVERVDKRYAQKRDRYATGSGIDFLHQASEDNEESDSKKGKSETQQARLLDMFTTQTAVTGGSAAIKELPKHLHNLDDEGILFDPKTGSMRGNPNTADQTRAFQGDLQRYRSGDYYTYLEMQLRFLNGESTSFVDFKLDEELQKRKQMQREEPGKRGDDSLNSHKGGEGDTARNQLIHSLYGESTLTSAASSRRMKEALSSASILPLLSSEASSSSLPAMARGLGLGAATRNGHTCVYGSYFDRDTFLWGYKCCRRLGKDAAACQSDPRTIAVAVEDDLLSLPT